MRAIDASQLIINELAKNGQSTKRDKLLKMLYLLDLTVFKHIGERLVDEDFSLIEDPFIEDVYKHFMLWKDSHIAENKEVKSNLNQQELEFINSKIKEISKYRSWEIDAIIFNQQNKGKTLELSDNMIDNYNTVKNEVLNRCRKLLYIGGKQVEFVEYGQKAHSLQKSLPEECIGLNKLDTDEVHISINRLDNGNYELRWDSYDTFEGLGTEVKVFPAEFIHDFDNYYEKIKDKIEANNEIEKTKSARYNDNDKIRVLKAKQLEVEQIEAKLKVEQEKLDKLKATLLNSGIEL
jgi:hypothetical protein